VRLVYYSLANTADAGWERQWIRSIRSLRRHNTTIPVWLLVFNGASPRLLEEARRQAVTVQYLGEYRDYLDRIHVRGSVLALYPTFHKFLALRHVPVRHAAQILYVDCDTFFFDDVGRLFDAYTRADWYAREEPMSRRSRYGYNPSHVDEEMLAAIASREAIRAIAPFNSGVCVLNNQVWRRLDRIRVTLLDVAWRLLAGRELLANQAVAHDPSIQRAALDAANELDRARMLPYPSTNTWIIEQIALWLALGHLPRLSLGLLSPHCVAQGAEFREPAFANRPPIVAHYYSVLEDEFFSSLDTARV